MGDHDHVRFTAQGGKEPGTLVVSATWEGLPTAAPAEGTARVLTKDQTGQGVVAALIPYRLTPDLPATAKPARMDFDWTQPGTRITATIALVSAGSKGSLPSLAARLNPPNGPFTLNGPDADGKLTVEFSPDQRGFFRSTVVILDTSKPEQSDLFQIPVSGGAP